MICIGSLYFSISHLFPNFSKSSLILNAWCAVLTPNSDGSQPGSIDISHKGPCAVYMKKVQDSTASNNAAGGGWFKIMEDGYDQTAGTWCTEKLIPNDGHLQAIIPTDLAPGYYLLRPELLALHQADKTPPDPQFYVGCAQIFVASAGSSAPSETVSIPGYVNMSTPAMTFNIWQIPMKLPFPDFGPPLYTGSNAKRDTQAISTTQTRQTIGLKPEQCVMENGNWCAFIPPVYFDQASCYSVRHCRGCIHLSANDSSRPRQTALCKQRPATTKRDLLAARIVIIGKITVLISEMVVRQVIIMGPPLQPASCPLPCHL